MRRVYVLHLSLCVGCSGSSISSSGDRLPTLVDVSIPAPPAGPDRVERRRPESATDLSGTWRFVHGGEPWFVARVQRQGARWTADLTFVEEISWVHFHIGRMVVPPPGGDRDIVFVGVDDDGDERQIKLRFDASGMKLEGTVEGSSYAEPFSVVATRVR